MQATFSHIQVNIDFTNIAFYKELMNLLEWKEVHVDDSMAGYRDSKGADMWFSQAPEGGTHNHSAVGLSHIGIATDTAAHVDEATEFLKKHNITPLYDTPKHRSEFAMDDASTYYQVMFESPDKILFEIMYAGPK